MTEDYSYGNIYDTPEIVRLKKIGECGYYNWDWSIFAVWQGSGGGLYYDFQSGCSCYGPWEGVRDKESLIRCRGYDQLEKAVFEWADSTYGVTRADAHDMLHDLHLAGAFK